jgi:hypothetical protein
MTMTTSEHLRLMFKDRGIMGIVAIIFLVLVAGGTMQMRSDTRDRQQAWKALVADIVTEKKLMLGMRELTELLEPSAPAMRSESMVVESVVDRFNETVDLAVLARDSELQERLLSVQCEVHRMIIRYAKFEASSEAIRSSAIMPFIKPHIEGLDSHIAYLVYVTQNRRRSFYGSEHDWLLRDYGFEARCKD